MVGVPGQWLGLSVFPLLVRALLPEPAGAQTRARRPQPEDTGFGSISVARLLSLSL